ncbi:MAG: CvpA family protein [Clostridia bacterium]
MTFNIVDVVILVVLGISLISGMYKGFLSSGLTTVGFVAAFFGAQTLYPQLSAAVQSNASLMNVLTYYLDAPSMFKTVGLAEQSVVGASQSGLLTQAVAELKTLPNAILTTFQSNVDRQVFSSLDFGTLGDYLNQTILVAVINVIAFLLLFAIAYLLVLLLVNLFNNVFHFPLLKHFDWLLGGAFGLVRGGVIVALLLSVVPMALSVVNLTVLDQIVAQSQLAAYFPTDFAIADIIVKAFQ